jgi:hypothetical protein
MTGVVSVQGMDLPLTMQIINGKAIRVDVEAMGQKVVNVYNEGKGWKIDPFNGTGEPTDVDGAELAGYKSQTLLASSLMNFRNLGNKIELAGEETIDGLKHYKIKLTAKEDGAVGTYFIRSTDFGITKAVNNREIQGQQMEIETLFSDIKEFGGLKFYMTRAQQADGQVFQTISLTNVELNATIDPKIFNK